MNNDTMYNGSPEEFTAASLADLERLSTPEEPQDITIGDLIGLLGQCASGKPIQIRRRMLCVCGAILAPFSLRKTSAAPILWECDNCGHTVEGSAGVFEAKNRVWDLQFNR